MNSFFICGDIFNFYDGLKTRNVYVCERALVGLDALPFYIVL